MGNEPVFVTLLVVEVLERLQIPYLIGGSFASAAYGRVRTTQDVDIVARMELHHVNDLVQALGAIFYADELMIQGAIRHKTSFNLIHLQTMFKVDVFIAKERAFDRQQLARRVERVIDQDSRSKAYFASAEDTVLSKLEWFRMGGEESEQQWRDIKGVLQLRRDELDISYLTTWAANLHVADLLDRALQEAES